MTTHTPYTYRGKTMLIERYALLGEQECAKDEYDLFDLTVASFAQEKMAEAEQNGYDGFPVFADQCRELFTTFKYYPSPENKKIYLCAEVFSLTKTKVLLCLMCSRQGKIWLNGKCLSVHGNEWVQPYLSGTLNKGRNVILVEMYSPNDTTRLSIQLMNYRFEKSDDFKALSNMNSLVNIDPIMLIHEPRYAPTANTFRLMCILNDETKYQTEYRVAVHDSNTGLVKCILAKTGEPVEIDAAELRGLHDEPLRHSWITSDFAGSDGRQYVAGLDVFTKDFFSRSAEIADECVSLSMEQSAKTRTHAMGLFARLQNARWRRDYNGIYWTSWQLRELRNRIKSGTYQCETYKTPGLHEFYIPSNLDDSQIYMLARIPDGYTGQQAYPVILALATGNEGGFCWTAGAVNGLNNCLIFDITGRGFTGGSYVGEASTMEIMDWIFANYAVDRDKVYVLGGSNGGFATWALAQNYPHIPAAIYPHTGYPAIKTIENVSNIPTYQVVSPKDHVFAGRANEVKKRLKSYSSYTQYDFQEMLHHHLGTYMSHPGILKQLTSHQRDLWPERVILRTPRNRHRESFWVRLHGIARGEYAEVTARIDSPERISVRLKNTNGVTLTVPPQMDRNGFEVVVNGRVLSFADYQKPTVILCKEKGTWRVAESEPAVDYRRGTGLLDIYLNSLRIITPDDATGETLTKIAHSFSTPSSSGAYPEVFTKYPVYKANAVPEQIFGHNLLLLEAADCPNSYVRRFADKLVVQCDKTGYTYNDVRTNGGYVVMQAMANPFDLRRTFLIISTNDDNLLRRHILLRKVIIPTYINGIHPLWNNEILVFDGKQYQAAYVTGDALSSVSNMNGGVGHEK